MEPLPGTSQESILPPLFGRAHAAAKALESRVENSFGDSTHQHIGDFDNTLVESPWTNQDIKNIKAQLVRIYSIKIIYLYNYL